MNIDIPRETFVDAAAWIARTLSTKPVLPILGGVLIESSAERITFSAYDYENSAQIDLDTSLLGGNETGSVLVSGRLLAGIARQLPAGGEVHIEASGPNAALRCGKATFTLPTMLVAEYPQLPIQPKGGIEGIVSAAELSGALAEVLPAASRDDAQPKLVSVCVEITSGSLLTLFCTDKHRVAIRTLPWKSEYAIESGQQMLLPSRAAGELARMSVGDLTLNFSGGVFGVFAGNRRTTARLLAEKYPDVRKIIPAEFATWITFDTDEWSSALGRAMLLDEQEYPRIKLNIYASGDVELTGGQAGIGGLNEIIGGTVFGEGQTVWLNPRYLMDALRTLGAKKGVLRVTQDLRPVVVQPLGHEPNDLTNLHMIMPVTGVTD